MKTLKAFIAIVALVAGMVVTTPAPVKAASVCSASDYYEMLNMLNGYPHSAFGLGLVTAEFQSRCSANEWWDAQAYVAQYVHDHSCGLDFFPDPYCDTGYEQGIINLSWDGVWSYLASHSGG